MSREITIPEDITSCGWYSNLNARLLMFHIVIMAAEECKETDGALRYVTSHRRLSDESGIPYTQSRTALARLVKDGCITIEPVENKASVITVLDSKRWYATHAKTSADGDLQCVGNHVGECVREQDHTQVDIHSIISLPIDSRYENEASGFYDAFSDRIPDDRRDRDLMGLQLLVMDMECPFSQWQEVAEVTDIGATDTGWKREAEYLRRKGCLSTDRFLYGMRLLRRFIGCGGVPGPWKDCENTDRGIRENRDAFP